MKEVGNKFQIYTKPTTKCFDVTCDTPLCGSDSNVLKIGGSGEVVDRGYSKEQSFSTHESLWDWDEE